MSNERDCTECHGGGVIGNWNERGEREFDECPRCKGTGEGEGAVGFVRQEVTQIGPREHVECRCRDVGVMERGSKPRRGTEAGATPAR